MDASPPPLPRFPGRPPRLRSPFLAILLGWLVPGLGRLSVGRPFKAFLFFLATVPTYFVGLWLTDFTAVNPSKYGLEFAAHVLSGGPTALALHLCEGRIPETLPRWFDVGRLYVAVGALLNVVAISDALGEVLDHNRRVGEIRRRREAAWPVTLPAEDDLAPAFEGNGSAAPLPSPQMPPLLPDATWPHSASFPETRVPEEPR